MDDNQPNRRPVGGLVYDIAMLGDPDDGLWVSWRERTRPRPGQARQR